ncbi:hypothetical protein DVA67_029565 [Solirubrobacter sp. CPCC 204708]|uniref:CARDB domain-containing protein n=1 Tax=Solirubrobacter deserti TaxID=2282478 RepID=A0ABT4RMT3_9ACTN|nr:hypothetical protein [Solirubrobacter deserti]MBE2320151.1 hypothetical protein [Solirubrobacter deserti]MDA0139871.1 hypothetical protein [Solirubrobacter deserti]
MRKSFFVASVATLALGTAGVAYAQLPDPSIEATGSGSPSKAGTKSKPKAVTFKLDVKNNAEAKTTAKSIKITFPKTIKVSTKGLNECDPETDQALIDDPSQCSSSKAGKGSASANLNPFSATPAPLNFQIQPYVGKNEILFLLSGSANTILHGKIKGQSMTIEITPDLQQPVTGVFSALNEIAATIKAKKGKNSLISAVGCSGGKHTIGVEVAYVGNPNPPAKPSAKDSFDIKCSK